MSKRRQLKLFDPPLPAHVQVVDTSDLDLSTEAGVGMCVQRMFAVPLDKSVLLDFLVGYKRGDGHASEAHAELHRLQLLLNSRYRGKRFDPSASLSAGFTGPSLAASLFRQSIRTQGWDPLREWKVAPETDAALDRAVVFDYPEEILATGRDISLIDRFACTSKGFPTRPSTTTCRS